MAEPYDTINGKGSSPKAWWRFSDASGGVTNEGSDAAGDLSEYSVSGTFNGTYRYEANPAGDGWGILLNGQGGLRSTGLTDDFDEVRGTYFIMFRSQGTVTNPTWLFGSFRSFDIDYNRLGINGNGRGSYRVQDAGGDDISWAGPVDQDLLDGAVHTLAVTNGSGPTDVPKIYVDGAEVSADWVFSGSNVDYDHWPGVDYIEDWAVGYRGGVNTSPVGGIVIYEALAYDEATPLTDQDIEDIHIALGGSQPNPFGTKSIRRTNRRIFADWTAI